MHTRLGLGAVLFVLLNTSVLLPAAMRGSRNTPVQETTSCRARISGHEGWLNQAQLDKVLAENSSPTILQSAQIIGCKISSPLTEMDLTNTRFSSSDLSGMNCQGCKGNQAEFDDSDLDDADFSGAELQAKFSGIRCKLRRASFNGAKLHGSTFQNVDLRDAEFWGADLTGVHFTPLQLPDENSLAHAKNLQTMRGADPTALRALASHFREVGNSDREREVTYAMEASLQQKAAEICRTGKFSVNTYDWADRTQQCFLYPVKAVAFGFTCNFGLSPWKPLRLLFGLWVVFTLILILIGLLSRKTMFAVVVRYTVAGKTRTRELPLRVFLQHRGRSSRWSRHGHTLVRILRLSARVSMMNLFNLQFEQVDVGRWLKLLSGRDYEVRTFGIARSISGVESLISFYLIALWVLAYFGHPFLQ